MTVLIIDGNNLASRARFVFKDLTRGGLPGRDPVGVHYGTLKLVDAVIDEWDPSSVVIAWDAGCRRRKELYPEYKAHRHDRDEIEQIEYEDYIRQLTDVRNFLEGTPIYNIMLGGIEADDIMYWASVVLGEMGYDVVIVTSDNDLLQAISPTCKVYLPIKKLIVSEENFEDYTGVCKEVFTQYKAMMGDSGDGVPGIRHIGEKRAQKLLNEWGNWDGVLNAAESNLLTPALTRYIVEGKEDYPMWYKLVNIPSLPSLHKEVISELSVFTPYDDVYIRMHLLEWGFSSLLMSGFGNKLSELDSIYHQSKVVRRKHA